MSGPWKPSVQIVQFETYIGEDEETFAFKFYVVPVETYSDDMTEPQAEAVTLCEPYYLVVPDDWFN